MLSQIWLSSLLATAALANLTITLTNTVSCVTEHYEASTDGTPVLIDSTSIFDLSSLECLGLCIPEYHCTLYDRSLTTAVVTINPGRTWFPSTEVGHIVCGYGLVLSEREGTGFIAVHGDGLYYGAAESVGDDTWCKKGTEFYLPGCVQGMDCDFSNNFAERTFFSRLLWS